MGFQDAQVKHAGRPFEREAVPPLHVLCVEDDAGLRVCFAKCLAEAGYAITTAGDGLEAWESLQRNHFDLLLVDDRMPRMSGRELVVKVRRAGLTLPIITAASSLEFFGDPANRWLQVAAQLQKPFGPEELLATVDQVLRAAPGSPGPGKDSCQGASRA